MFGLVAAWQLIAPDLGRDVAWLGWGRVRYAHTQGIMLGWLANAFFAFLYHAVPILTGRPVTSARLGVWIFALWNLAVMAPGWVLVLAGVSQPLEWAEFPLVVDVVAILALALAAVQFLPGFFRRGIESLYVSSWYIIGGLVFTLLSYPMGNVVPEFLPAVPVDWMSGEPVRYERHDTCGFRIRGCGDDGVDQGGNVRCSSFPLTLKATAGKRPWAEEGYDLVWPSRAGDSRKEEFLQRVERNHLASLKWKSAANPYGMDPAMMRRYGLLPKTPASCTNLPTAAGQR